VCDNSKLYLCSVYGKAKLDGDTRIATPVHIISRI
jgi:hypothetical protein